ncbi:unnamed protein product [Allacma fusca]|uniref:Uncharacterized protein n=1 Tax=Allacma fusca TaxID=39272 RepID=A0A8J2LJ50_9HEXA|nr:unnamed protein product [Allacma fusca]
MSFQMAQLDVDNLNLDCGLEKSNLSVYAPYGNSKLATILFTRELARRLGENSNINTYALCPGAVFTRNLEREPFFARLWIKFAFFNGSDGCLNTLHCTLSKSLENQSGKMYRLLDVWDIEDLVSDQQAGELWKKSEELVGITFKKP